MVCVSSWRDIGGCVATCMVVVALGACGNSGGGGGSKPSSTKQTLAGGSHGSSGCGEGCSNAGAGGGPRPASTASRPGCGELCQNAGPAAGNAGQGSYSCAPGGCARCPENGCLGILSASVLVERGQFAVRLQCLATRSCVGAFVLWKPGSLSASDRLAGSDVSIGAGQTAEYDVGVTPLGVQLAQQPGGVHATAFVVLEGFGYDSERTLLMQT